MSSPMVRSHRDSCLLELPLTITLEPGYYEDGKFGVRIESMLPNRT